MLHNVQYTCILMRKLMIVMHVLLVMKLTMPWLSVRTVSVMFERGTKSYLPLS